MNTIEDLNTPIDSDNFVKQFEKKFQKWGNTITNELKETWKQNCLVFNNVIANKDKARKYIVSAPTGSAKTENMITYCAMLPSEYKVLISTNLTSEADRIAQDINNECNANKAISYHSKKNNDDKAISISQVLIVSHEFYRRHHCGDNLWEKVVKNRDLIIIDEVLDTMDEYTINQNEVEKTFNFFTNLHTKKYRGNNHFEKCLTLLAEDLNQLTNASYGKAALVSEDKLITVKNVEGKPVQIYSLHVHRYFTFLTILETEQFDYNEILTTIKDASKNDQLKKMIINTLQTLNNLHNKQAYMTSNKGIYALHRVVESLPQQSLVCFDATADVNSIYDLRSEFHDDIVKINKIPNVRDYSNVTLYAATTRTGAEAINDELISSALLNVSFGNKTLIITHKNNKPLVEAEVKKNYSSKNIDIVNWGAVTGLNTWQDFDTCVVLGLNNKPVSFVQNRVLINSNKEEAFGINQSMHYDKLRTTDIASEVIQAINRIRIRKIIDKYGNCDKANIYLTLPYYGSKELTYFIKTQMRNIQVSEWKIPKKFTINQKSHRDNVISYLLKNTNRGDKILLTKPRDDLNIKKESYKSVVGKTIAEKSKFESKLKTFGFEVVEELVTGSKTLVKKKFIKRLF